MGTRYAEGDDKETRSNSEIQLWGRENSQILDLRDFRSDDTLFGGSKVECWAVGVANMASTFDFKCPTSGIQSHNTIKV